MTRKLIVVIGAAIILALNALFLVALVTAGLIHDWKEKGRKW
jgi:type II secretory pathway component PulK